MCLSNVYQTATLYCAPYLSKVCQVVSLEKQLNNLLNNPVVPDVAVPEMDEMAYQDQQDQQDQQDHQVTPQTNLQHTLTRDPPHPSICDIVCIRKMIDCLFRCCRHSWERWKRWTKWTQRRAWRSWTIPRSLTLNTDCIQHNILTCLNVCLSLHNTGTPGTPGTDGRDGENGTKGEKGERGPRGPSRGMEGVNNTRGGDI